MMNIKESVLSYINKENTEYAILITGDWGSGKTYYWKNVLEPEIKKIAVPKKNNCADKKYFDPVYISLNGITTIDDLVNQIIAESLNWGKIGKIGINLFKTAIGFLGSKALGENTTKELLDTLFGDINPLQKLNFSNKVFCFDDLERISKKINTEDVIGFINTNFVEHNHIKTIIITNEDEIDNVKDNGLFQKIKEKVFGVSLKYEPNIDKIFDDLLNTYKEKNNKYFGFLLSNTDFILSLLNENHQKNIRTPVFALQFFEDIFMCSKDEVINNFGKRILFFFLLICFEFKSGALKANDYNNPKIKDFTQYLFQRSLDELSTNKTEKSERKEYNEIFYEKYLKGKDDEYIYFNSIYQYVLTGYFDRGLYKDEISKILNTNQTEWESCYKLLTKFRALTDFEFQECIQNIVKFIKQGKYNLYMYPTLINYLYLFVKDGIIDYDEQEMKAILKEGIDKSLEITKYNLYLDESLEPLNSTIVNDTEIKDYIIEKHNFLKDKSSKNDIEKFINSLSNIESNPVVTYKTIQHIPIFNYYSPSYLLEIISKLENDRLNLLNRILRDRYKASNIDEYFLREKEVLTELVKLIEKEDINKSLKKLLLKELCSILNDAISKLKKPAS